MKVAFIFDTILAKDENNNFYGMTLNYDFFESRYLTMFDHLIVTTRAKNKELVKGSEGYKIVNGEKVDVKPIYEYKEIPNAITKRKKIEKKLKEIIKSVDKVIIRMPSVLGIFACNICKKINKEYIIEMVACPWDGYRNHTNPVGKIIAPIMYLETRKCIKKAPQVLYVTNKFLQKRYPTKGMECGCSDVVLNNVEKKIIQKRINKIKKSNLEELKLCTVANVGMKYKGHKYVFKAIYELKKIGKNYKYYLIGNGDQTQLKDYAKKLKIEENIVFLGSLPHNDVFKKLEEMDLYVQPSLQEGLPRALVEAMSLGMPAIGSKVGGIPELLNNQMIFRPKRTRELINILKKINKKIIIENINYNYNESLKYLPQRLNKIRSNFYLNKNMETKKSGKN